MTALVTLRGGSPLSLRTECTSKGADKGSSSPSFRAQAMTIGEELAIYFSEV